MTASIKKCFNIEAIRSFYMSDVYPIIVCALTVIANATGLEFYIAILHVAMAVFAMVISDSIRPTVISLVTFVMQLSVKNSPFHPGYSDYYYTGWRFPVFIIMCIAVFAGLVTFVIRNGLYKKISFKSTPCLLPIIILAAAFLLNGIFSDAWVVGDLIFGFANAVVYSLVFLLIYHGFSESEDSDELARYFAYISMLVAIVIMSELTVHFITSDNVFVNGELNKTWVSLGWGIWTVVGSSLSVLIPAMFYGVHFCKYPWLYFSVATLTVVFSALTMSRNALLFGAIAYAACVLISCFKGRYKKVFRVITVVGILILAVFVIVFWKKFYSLFAAYFEHGIGLNGREELWPAAIKNFLNFPIFGRGFYGLEAEDFSYGPLALQAHNTVLQLLSATGIVGFLAYAYYRFSTMKPVFCRPSLKKTFMAMSIGVLLLGSMLDNFVFFIYPTFHYTVALAIIHKSAKEEL